MPVLFAGRPYGPHSRQAMRGAWRCFALCSCRNGGLTVCSGPGAEHATVRQLDSAETAPAASRAERCANPMPARAARHEDASICSRPSRLGSRQSTHLLTHIVVCSVRRFWRYSAKPGGYRSWSGKFTVVEQQVEQQVVGAGMPNYASSCAPARRPYLLHSTRREATAPLRAILLG